MEVFLSTHFERIYDDKPFELTRERFLDKVHPDMSEAAEILDANTNCYED